MIHNNQREDEIINQLFYLGKMFKFLDMSFEDVYRAYFVKNVLNEFRQNNGYKKGTYIKEWEIDIGEGIKNYEDNEIAYHLAQKIPLENLNEILPIELEKIYEKAKENNKKLL